MKSECTHTRRLLSDYIDGVLDTAKATAVSEHLHDCRDCAQEHEALKSLIQEMGNIRPIKAPDDFLEGLHKRINQASILDRVREALSFTQIRIPAELAAFATTALLVLFFFYFFPSVEKDIIPKPGDRGIEFAMDREDTPVRPPGNQDQTGHPMDSPSPAPLIEEQHIPIRLALSLTTRQETVQIPSQSVSYGNSIVGGDMSDDPYSWQTEKENDTKEIIITPDEVNLKIDEIIKFVEARVISRENNMDNGYPSSLTLSIPGVNYRRFIARLDSLGALETPAPALQDVPDNASVLIQMELSPRE